MKNVIHIFFLLIFASSCASLSEKECKSGDWRSIGYDDGKSGQNKSSRLQEHGKACGEYGISPDLKSYEDGYRLGNEIFCANSGEEHGKKGDMVNVPSLCLDSKKFVETRKVGFQDFCKNQGIESGKNVDDSKASLECRNSESYKQGYEEGLRQYCHYDNGLKLGISAQEHKAKLCPLHLESNFLAGYNKGILDYCSKRNGFQLAKENKQPSYHLCPHSIKADFEKAYQQGTRYLELKMQVAELETSREKIVKKMQDTLISPDLKKHLLSELDENKRKQDDVKIQMAKIEGFVGI
jgi:hypothetical protein